MPYAVKMICGMVLALSVWQTTGSEASAQSNYSRITKPYNRPTVSPYLNMFRNGNGPVMNYFGAVRPQQQFYSQNEQFGQQLEAVQGRQNRQRNRNQMSNRIPGVYTMGITGHAVGFNTIRSSGSGDGQGESGSSLSGFNSPQSGGGNQFGGGFGQSSNFGFGSGFGSSSGFGRNSGGF